MSGLLCVCERESSVVGGRMSGLLCVCERESEEVKK